MNERWRWSSSAGGLAGQVFQTSIRASMAYLVDDLKTLKELSK